MVLRGIPSDGCVLQVMGDALLGRMPPVPTYVLDCDFEYENGRGNVLFTQKRQEAKHFATGKDALEYWRTQSKVRPLRDDGHPNRPLTAYHMCILRDGTDPM